MKLFFFILIFISPFLSLSQELEINTSCINNKNVTFFHSLGFGAKYDYLISPKYKLELGFIHNSINWDADTVNADTSSNKQSLYSYILGRTFYYFSFLYRLDSAQKINLFIGPFFGLQRFKGFENRTDYYFSHTYPSSVGNKKTINQFSRLSLGLNIKIEFPRFIIKKLSFVFTIMPGIIIDDKIFSRQKGISPYLYYPRLFNEIHWGLKYNF
jgi:hypothetical protein